MNSRRDVDVLVQLIGIEVERGRTVRSRSLSGNADAADVDGSKVFPGNESERRVFEQWVVDGGDDLTWNGVSRETEPAHIDDGRTQDLRVFDDSHLPP